MIKNPGMVKIADDENKASSATGSQNQRATTTTGMGVDQLLFSLSSAM